MSRPPCFQFRDNGHCAFGDRCRFAHGDDDHRIVAHNGPAAGAYGAPEYGAPVRRQAWGFSAPVRSPGLCYTFRDTGDCAYGDSCRFSHGEQDQRVHAAPAPRAYGGAYGAPHHPHHAGPVGGFHGAAAYGAPAPRSGGACFAFRDTGFCKYGDSCRFVHDGVVQHHEQGGHPHHKFGYSRPASAGVCFEFRDTGSCAYGNTCKFVHPGQEVAAAEAPQEWTGEHQEQAIEAVPAQVATATADDAAIMAAVHSDGLH